MKVGDLDPSTLCNPVIMEWDVVGWGGTSPGEARVIWVAPDRQEIALLRLDGKSWPECMPYNFVWSMVDSGAWTYTVGAPITFTPLSLLSQKQRALRDQNWHIVGPLLQYHVPEIFHKKARARLAKVAALENCVSERFVMNLLKRAFSNGLSKDSVRSTLYRNGKYKRAVSSESPKLGRKRLYGAEKGINIHGEIKQYFKNTLILFWSRNKRINMDDAYHDCLRTYFMDEVGDILDDGEHRLKDIYRVSGVPTLEQFRYWAPKLVDIDALTKRKLSSRIYEQKYGIIVSTSNIFTWGPGGRFQVDATILDVYLRSRLASRQLIGRPTLYVIIDTFSRLIVGFYIGLESPSWIAAMMALANCVDDKVEYCRQFGVNIQPEEWPTGMIPGRLLGDRGEIERAVADNMIDMMKIVVETAAAYRGDWKGIVESVFRTIPAIFRPYVPGYIETDFKKRGVRDYRADGALDLDDLTRTIIELILYHNNYHVLTSYDRHPKMTEDDVPSVPLAIWNWGIANLSGVARQPDPVRFRFGLMPQAQASVTRVGLVFENRYYFAPELESAVKSAREKGVQKVIISYDKRRTDLVYVHSRLTDLGYFPAARIERSGATVTDMSAWEEEGRRLLDKETERQAQSRELVKRANAQGRTAAIARSSVEKSKEAASQSVLAQVKNIRRNRREELVVDRKNESQVFMPPPPDSKDGNALPPNNVVSFPKGRAIDDIPNFTVGEAAPLEDYDD